MPPKKKKKPQLTAEELEEQRRKNRERQQLYRQRKKEEKEKEQNVGKREQPMRRCRKSSVLDDPDVDAIGQKEESDSDSDYGMSRRESERARKRKRRESERESATTGDEKAARDIESRKKADRVQHEKIRKTRELSATFGNDDAMQKVESIKLANRAQHVKQRASRLEAATSGDEDAMRKIESAKLANRDQHVRQRTSRLEAAASGNDDEVQKIETTKLADKVQHDLRRSSRRISAAHGEENSRQEIEAERDSNRIQHEKRRSKLRDAAVSGDKESLSMIEMKRLKDRMKHAEKRKSKKDYDFLPKPHYLGRMNVECPYCGALHFPGERRCCNGGTVFVPPERKMPQVLHQLIYDVNQKEHNPFMYNILKYNNLFAFGSTQYQHVRQAPFGVQSAKTLGSIRHFTSACFPNRKNLLFGNFYVYDHVEASQHRCESKFAEGLDKKVIEQLSELFEKSHPYSHFYRNMKNVIDENEKDGKDTKSIRMRIVEFDEFKRRNLDLDLQGTHQGVYSTARCGDFVSLYASTDVDQNIVPFGIKVYQKLGQHIPRAIFSWRKEIDCFCYPILAPFAEIGFKPAHWLHQKPKSFADRLEEFKENDKEKSYLEWDEYENETVYIGSSHDDSSDEDEDTARRKKYRKKIVVSSGSEESSESEDDNRMEEGEERTVDGTRVEERRETRDDEAEIVVDGTVDFEEEYDEDGNCIMRPVGDLMENHEVIENDVEIEEEAEINDRRNFDKEYEKTIEQHDSNPDHNDSTSDIRFEYRGDQFYPCRSGPSDTNDRSSDIQSDSDHDDLDLPNVIMTEDEDVSEDEVVESLNMNELEMDDVEDREVVGPEMEMEKDEEDEMNKKLDAQMAEAEGDKEINGKYVSRLQYMLYRSQRRKKFRSRLCSAGKLGQVYQMDQFSRVIQNRMYHIRKHNTQTMMSTRRKLVEALQRKVDRKKAGVTIGAVTSVPASVMGSPRYMRRKFENAVAMANKLGNPSVFLTFTASSNWREIKETLGADTWANNPYVVTEVFKKKYEKLLDVVVGKPVKKGSRERRKGIWGEVEWYTFSVEFQQRGAPHIHLLLRLKNPPKSGDEVDLISQATLPVLPSIDDPSYDAVKRLRDLVEQHHVHRPCENDKSAYCNVGRKDHWKTCKKRFPKEFRSQTELGDKRYPDLKRPDDGEFCEKKVKGKVFRADNRHIVAYNPTLLSLFETHINVEIVTSGGALKYLYKYVFKGFDRVLLETLSTDGTSYGNSGEMINTGHLLYPKNAKIPKGVELERQEEAAKLLRDENIPLVDANGQKTVVYDETKLVEDMRAFTATEAAWHMSSYKITGSSHTIVSVFVHTPKEEPVHFEAGKEEEVAEKEDDEFRTYLKSWFVMNGKEGKDGEVARNLTYDEMPKYFGQKDGKWVMRRRNWSKHIIGHVYSVHPRNTEQFAIRLLSQVVKGPRSFEELRTVDGVVYDTFVGAAKRRNLMNDQEEWMKALKEAALTELPITLRRLFISILVFNSPTNALELWNENKAELINRNTWPVEKKEAHALHHIASGLKAHGITLRQLGLPEYDIADLPARDDWDDDNEGEDLSQRSHEKIADENYGKLNNDQKKAMDIIMNDIKDHKHSSFFVHGTGGTGKTFLYRTLYHRMKADGLNVVCVAHTGIAATLLPAGQTAHRAFNIPLLVQENMHSKLEYETEWADYLRNVDVVVFDEATMLDRRVLAAIDELFVLLHPERQGMIFGGVVFLFGGDWRQTLPIVDRVNGEAIIPYTIRRSEIWDKLHLLALKKNERASSDMEYSEWLNLIGNGVGYVDEKWQLVKLPKKLLARSEEELIEWMFGNGRIDDPVTSNFSCLLTVDNATTEELNNIALAYIKKELVSFESIDVYDQKSGFEFLPPEAYHNMLPSGLPPHILKLKIGCVVILLRNINVHLGLCNGTRMRVVEIGKDIVKCAPITKNGKTPDTVVLSRIAMSTAKPTSKDVAFIRSQFPIRLAHSMTINKSQGQTLDRVGVILRTPVFSHGQFYVACSRVRRFEDIKVFVHNKESPDVTRNVVYHDILLD